MFHTRTVGGTCDRIGVRRTLCAGLLLLTGPASAQDVESTLAARLEERVERAMEQVSFPGMAIGVVRSGELEYHAGFGVADLAAGTEVDEHTLFQIGSVTKAFTTTLLGILVEEGTLDLSSPLARHLPEGVEFPSVLRDGRITIEHLASHLSGLPASPTIKGREIDSELVLSFSHFELYKSLESVELLAEPGKQFNYSMLGYGLLGHVFELETGRPFELLLRERLLEPLGMSASTVTLRPEHLESLATPYHITPDRRIVPTMAMDMEALAPAGGLTSSVADLAAFLSLHLGGLPPEKRVVSEETLARHYERRWSFSDRLGYGLGWGADRLPGVGLVVFHDGRASGYTSYVGFSREHHAGVIVLANLGGDATPRPIRELGRGMLQAVVGNGR